MIKNYFIKVLASAMLMLSCPMISKADDFGLYDLDFSTFQDQNKDYEFALKSLQNTRKYGIEYSGNVSTATYNGIYGKVASKVKSSAPRQSTGQQRSRTGSYNYQTSDAHLQWKANRQAQIQEQRRRAEERKREEERRRRIEDDNRQAAVTAATHARLQGQTNRAMERDHWHATQGAQLAVDRARSAHNVQGPQLTNQRAPMSNAEKAKRMQQANRPRQRAIPPNPKLIPRNKRPLRPVRRTAKMTPEREYAMKVAMAKKEELARKSQEAARAHAQAMTMAKAEKRKELERKYAEDRKIIAAGRSNTRFELSRNATSSLGKDWNKVSLKTPEIPGKRKMTAEELHRLKVIEFIEKRPLTPSEERYYRNLYIGIGS